VFAAAQRRPTWKIADGNDLLRGLVKKKLLDDSRKETPDPIHQTAKVSNKFLNFSKLIDQNHSSSEDNIYFVASQLHQAISPELGCNVFSVRQGRYNGSQARDHHLSRT
jgi:hypothetical protein